MAEYIEKDALRRAMYHEAFETDTNMQRWNSGCWIRYKMFENVIEVVPLADVVPVVHGKWIDGKVRHIKNGELRPVRECSVCGSSYFVYDYYNSIDEIPNYCPNCGAKMDGGADHDN